MSEGLKEIDDTSRMGVNLQKDFTNIIVLGTAVPDKLRDHRISVCTVAYSSEYGLIRIYPVPTESPIKLWHKISLPLERNPLDNRVESWKIQGSKNEWSRLSNKITDHGKISETEKLELFERLKRDHSYGCIEDINDKQLSLGIIIPSIIDKKLIPRNDADSSNQTALFDMTVFKTIHSYALRPVIEYKCPKCRSKNHHKQTVLEWGIYEYFRKNPQRVWSNIWDNLHIDDPLYDRMFLVGNMHRHRNSFLIITVFRQKQRL